jgi:tellurite resistance protein TerC
METMLLFWISFNIFILGMLYLDLNVFHKKAHQVAVREALKWSLVWILLSLGFAAILYGFVGADKGEEFLAGYVVEKSLSIDNIFVFSVIFKAFSIPLQYQHRVLFWGILGALILRALMIWFGFALITYFHPIIYLLGAFLIFTGLKVFWVAEKPLNLEMHPVILFLQRYIPLTPHIEGQQLWVRLKTMRRWQATPLLVALVLIECSDLLFAVDSIPAVFAITLDPFIVYTSNVFAILGLRSLYFLLADAIERFSHLKSGVALILCFVGMKMVMADVYKISIKWSLLIILFILGGSILFPYLLERRKNWRK